MKDREIIEKYMKSLKEELCMYSENLSEKTLPYIDELKHRYDKWEKRVDKSGQMLELRAYRKRNQYVR